MKSVTEFSDEELLNQYRTVQNKTAPDDNPLLAVALAAELDILETEIERRELNDQ
jgi:hypothetical protein